MDRICIILLVNLIFYAKTVRYGYVSDDILSAKRNHPINVWKWALWVFEGRLKSKPAIDHLLTIILHALVCVGIYLGFGHNNISFLAALLFSVNPINNQGAVWISGRGYVLSALGMVWALVLPFEVAWLMLLGATYSNAGFFMPVVLIGSNHPLLLIFMPFIWAFYYRRFKKNVSAKMDMEVFEEDKKIHPKKLILATKTFGFYLSHALLPLKTTFYHSLLESIAGSKSHRAYSLCRFFWFGLLSIIIMASYVILHIKSWDMICFGILWWCVGLAPFLNLYRMQQELAERYAYVPNIGLMIVLSALIYQYPYIVGAFLGIYVCKMWFYMTAYRNDMWLVEFSRLNSEDAWFSWHILAVKKWEMNSHQEALIFWMQALLLSPKEFKVLYNIGVVYILSRNMKMGMQYLEQAEQNIPRGQEKQINMILWQARHGEVKILI